MDDRAQPSNRQLCIHEPGKAMPRFLPAGDGGLTIELGDEISAGANLDVIALDGALRARQLAGVRETVPTYRSLLVLFDPTVLPRQRLIRTLRELWPPERTGAGRSVLWHVPVLYGGSSGVDLDEVAALHGLRPDAVVALHAGPEYRIYMIGFAPGFAYLGGLPVQLHTSRRTEPRLRTPPRSISIGGEQTAISPPLEIPSGWHLLGQTPVRSYDPRRADRPFLFEAGQRIRFHPISEHEYRDLCRAAEAGDIVARPEETDA